MLSLYKLASLLFFYRYVTFINASLMDRGDITCGLAIPPAGPAPNILADCFNALGIIPTHSATPFDTVSRKFLKTPGVNRHVVPPVLFRSGQCAIWMLPANRFPNHNATQPPHAGRIMHVDLFPKLRLTARQIIDKCLPKDRTGYNGGSKVTVVLRQISDTEDEEVAAVMVMVNIRDQFPGRLARSLDSTEVAQARGLYEGLRTPDRTLDVYQIDDSRRMFGFQVDIAP